MNTGQKRALLRILLCGALFLCVLVAVRLLAPTRTASVLLYLIPYLAIGYDVFWDAVRGIARGDLFDEKFLMSIATVGAFVIGEYPEAVFVLLFFRVGELFESVAVGKSRNALKELAKICPDTARVVCEDGEREVDVADVAEGTLIRILPGDRVPLDAIVLEGTSTLDTAALTGESLPRDVGVGDAVYSGTLNGAGVLLARTTGIAEQSTAARILSLVADASDRKARVEGFITRFSRFYTPTVCILAVILAVIPMFFHVTPADSIYRALSFLVISCPCALVISVPLSFFSGIGGAAGHGILFKGSRELEALAHADTVFFDKTGTLTEGRFSLEEAITAPDVSQDELLFFAASAESASTHPLARAVVAASQKKAQPQNACEIAGRGIRAEVDGATVLAGSATLLEENGIAIPAPLRMDGTVVYVAKDGRALGALRLCDTIKASAYGLTDALRSLGVRRTVLLSGDRKETAEAVASALSLDEVHASLLPEDKLAVLEAARTHTPRGLIYVGDGINDTPVLAASDCGIAMGALGSDAAAYAADVVLPTDDPAKIPTAIRHARRVKRIVWQNIIFALSVKLAVMVMSALSLSGIGAAVFADVGVSVIAILNAMRASRVRSLDSQ